MQADRNRDGQDSFPQILHIQCSFPYAWGSVPPGTSSDPEEVLGACVVVALPVMVLGPLGMRTETGLDAFASLMVYTFPGKVLLFHSQCQFVPSLQLESDPGPLPGSDREGSPERGHWVGKPQDGEVGEQPQGKSMPWAGSDWLGAEVYREALSVASHHAVGKLRNQNPSLNSKAEGEFHRDIRRLTKNSVAW